MYLSLVNVEEIYSQVLDLTMIEEGDPSLGRNKSSYQEYMVPSFLAQVRLIIDMKKSDLCVQYFWWVW